MTRKYSLLLFPANYPTALQVALCKTYRRNRKLGCEGGDAGGTGLWKGLRGIIYFNLTCFAYGLEAAAVLADPNSAFQQRGEKLTETYIKHNTVLCALL
jgi:hypothetical protein